MGQVSKTFTSKEYRASYPVPIEADGMRLDQFVQGFLASFSRQAVKKKIKKGEIRILKRSHPHKPSSKVYHREQVEIITYNEEDDVGEKPTLVYEDDLILVTTKPPFMATHPTGKHLFKCLTVFYEEKYGHTIHSIHRLDRETSGVQIMGKSPQGANLITPYFEQGKVKKAYFFIAKAYSNKLPQLKEFSSSQRLGQLDTFIPKLYTHCFQKDSEQGKHAHTVFKILYEESNYALGMAFPTTGRQHQIRAHAASCGYPLLGDKLYNGDVHIFTRYQDGEAVDADRELMEINRQALHALALKLPYPKEENKVFFAPIPEDLKTWIDENLKVTSEEVMKDIEAQLKGWCSSPEEEN